MTVGDPSPGYVRIVSIPPQSTDPVTIWFRDPGSGHLSTVFFAFAPGKQILIKFPSMPSAPGNSALQLNNIPCEGTWSIASQVETDVVLRFDQTSCRTEVAGSHAVGEVHFDPQTEPGGAGETPSIE